MCAVCATQVPSLALIVFPLVILSAFAMWLLFCWVVVRRDPVHAARIITAAGRCAPVQLRRRVRPSAGDVDAQRQRLSPPD